MTAYQFSVLEEYSDDKFLVKTLYRGCRSRALPLHLRPGQTVPVHPHPGCGVTLVPQKGRAVLVWEDDTEQALAGGVLYHAGVAPVFGLESRGGEGFQTLVILAQAEEVTE